MTKSCLQEEVERLNILFEKLTGVSGCFEVASFGNNYALCQREYGRVSFGSYVSVMGTVFAIASSYELAVEANSKRMESEQ